MNERLPIYDIEKEIVAALGTTRRLILQSPTASGKSTQVPQMLRNHGLLEGGRAVIADRDQIGLLGGVNFFLGR
jgi:ATP-dependent helicase HrpB